MSACRTALPALVLALAAVAAQGAPASDVFTPQVDTTALPASAQTWAEPNPVRGNADAIAVGRATFNQACAHCHGVDANGSRSPAPDLRRIGLACRRVEDAALRARCMADADAWFVRSVRYGKQKFGIVHMPAWDGYLSPELVWSLRSFAENAPR